MSTITLPTASKPSRGASEFSWDAPGASTSSKVLVVAVCLQMCGIIGFVLFLVYLIPFIFVAIDSLRGNEFVTGCFVASCLVMVPWVLMGSNSRSRVLQGANEALEINNLMAVIALNVMLVAMLIFFAVAANNQNTYQTFFSNCVSGCTWKLEWLKVGSIALTIVTSGLGLIQVGCCIFIYRFDFRYPSVEDEYAVGDAVGKDCLVPPDDRPLGKRKKQNASARTSYDQTKLSNSSDEDENEKTETLDSDRLLASLEIGKRQKSRPDRRKR